MNKIKNFCKEHKKEIIITGCLVGGTIAFVLTKGRFSKKHLIDVTGKSWISWIDTGKSISLEEVKEVLELNKDNAEACFAIVKDSSTKNGYIGVLLNNSKVL